MGSNKFASKPDNASADCSSFVCRYLDLEPKIIVDGDKLTTSNIKRSDGCVNGSCEYFVDRFTQLAHDTVNTVDGSPGSHINEGVKPVVVGAAVSIQFVRKK